MNAWSLSDLRCMDRGTAAARFSQSTRNVTTLVMTDAT
jgi:hypothetical protein